MLFFTNRHIDESKHDDSAFLLSFDTMGERLGYASASATDTGKGKATWALQDIADTANDDAVLQQLVQVFGKDKPVLIYLHGNNNTPAAAFYRGMRLEKMYGVNVVGFSWASEGLQPDGSDLAGLDHSRLDTDADDDTLAHVSEGNLREGWIARKIRRYRQAKANAQDSTYSLARFLRLAAVARLYADKQKFSLAAHSLGCHFIQKTLELDTVHGSLAATQNIALIAGCARSAQHHAWVSKLKPSGQVFITFTKADSVLAGATVADSGELKLGTSPGADFVRSPQVRYVDFEGARTELGAHRYFVADHGESLPKAVLRLFGAVFKSERDFAIGGNPKSIYPVGCNSDQSICYMGTARDPHP